MRKRRDREEKVKRREVKRERMREIDKRKKEKGGRKERTVVGVKK